MTKKAVHKRSATAVRSGGGSEARREVERVQTGVRLEKRILLVLKGFAAAHDLSLGDLLEGIVLHAFEGQLPFSPASLAQIEALRKVYGLDLAADDSHLLVERRAGEARARARRGSPS